MAPRGLLAGLLLVAALGLQSSMLLSDERVLSPGTPILLLAGLGVLFLGRRAGVAIGLAAASVVFFVSLGPGLAGHLGGARGGGVLAARLLEIVALLGAIALSGCLLAPRRRASQPPEPAVLGAPRRRVDWPCVGQVAGLLIISAVGAELLAAYGDSTGDVGGVVFSVVFFSALYGAPALLARELVRRRSWGWPSLLLIFAALGVTEACLIDQSLFSADYQGYKGWEESQRATRIPVLGLSAYNVWNFVGGHVIFSFGAAVALAEAWRPSQARRAWLGSFGMGLAGLAYLVSAALILSDPESRSGSPAQLAVAAFVVAALLAAAGLVGLREKGVEQQGLYPPLSAWKVLAATFPVALAGSLFAENWAGLSVGVFTTTTLGVGVLLASRRWEWGARHCAAVALAFLLVRGLLAFTYYPLLGDVTAVAKYTHNVVMLLAVALAGCVALRHRDREPQSERPEPGSDPQHGGHGSQ